MRTPSRPGPSRTVCTGRRTERRLQPRAPIRSVLKTRWRPTRVFRRQGSPPHPRNREPSSSTLHLRIYTRLHSSRRQEPGTDRSGPRSGLKGRRTVTVRPPVTDWLVRDGTRLDLIPPRRPDSFSGDDFDTVGGRVVGGLISL